MNALLPILYDTQKQRLVTKIDENNTRRHLRQQKLRSCALHNMECHTNGLLTVTYSSHSQYLPVSPFFGDTHHLKNSLFSVAAQKCCRSNTIQAERQNHHQSILPSSFPLLPTFYSQLEIEVECPLVRLQIYNLNILCLVLCYLNISLSYISNALSLFISLSPQYNGHVKAREQYKFLLCLSGF